nr:MAG TPA: hypothetical protein [Inoviridae sp.]
MLLRYFPFLWGLSVLLLTRYSMALMCAEKRFLLLRLVVL